ncbi:MAG TPA: hypothetical protein VG674_28230 [Amycolatopsis sp.]|nr:hypothetical protein [Amycolatopsis sp.]
MSARTESNTARRRSPAIPAAVLAVLSSAVLAGCGGADANQPAAAPKMSDLTQHASVVYKKGETGRKVQEIQVAQGSLVYIGIDSDSDGIARLDGYNVTLKVSAGKKATLVASADYPGVFTINFDRGAEHDLVARLEVGTK